MLEDFHPSASLLCHFACNRNLFSAIFCFPSLVYFLLLSSSQGQLRLSNAYWPSSQSSAAAFIGNSSHLLFIRLIWHTSSLNQYPHPMSQPHRMYALRPIATQIWPYVMTIFADKNNTPFFQDCFTSMCFTPKILDPTWLPLWNDFLWPMSPESVFQVWQRRGRGVSLDFSEIFWLYKHTDNSTANPREL